MPWVALLPPPEPPPAQQLDALPDVTQHRRCGRRRRGNRGSSRRTPAGHEVEITGQRRGLPGNLVVARGTCHLAANVLEDLFNGQGGRCICLSNSPVNKPLRPSPSAAVLPRAGHRIGDQTTLGRVHLCQTTTAHGTESPFEGIVAAGIEDHDIELTGGELIEHAVHVQLDSTRIEVSLEIWASIGAR